MSAWAEAMQGGAEGAVNMWLKFKQEQPKLALALSVLPVTGQLTAAAEYYDAIQRGDSVDAALAAVQMLPMGGVVKGAKFAGEAVASARHASQLADMAPIGADALSMRFAHDLRRMSDAEKLLALKQSGQAALATSVDAGNVVEYANKPRSQWAIATGGK